MFKRLMCLMLLACLTLPCSFAQDYEIGMRILKACRKYGIQDERLSLLLLREPDLTLTDNKFEGTALYWASRKNRPSTVSLLLEAGAGIEDSDYFGNTPLMAAAHKGNYEVVEMLLQYDPDSYAQNQNGKMAIQMAENGNHTNVVELINEYMSMNPKDISDEEKKSNPSVMGILAATKFLKLRNKNKKKKTGIPKATLATIIKAKILLKKKVNKRNVTPSIGLGEDNKDNNFNKDIEKLININIFIGSDGGSRSELTEAIEKLRKIKKELGLPPSEFEEEINSLKKARGRANWRSLRRKGLKLSSGMNAFRNIGIKNEKKKIKAGESAKTKLIIVKSLIGAGIKSKNKNKSLALNKEKPDRVSAKIKAINALLDIGKKKKEEKEEKVVRISKAKEKIKALNRFKTGGASFRNKIKEIEDAEKLALIKAAEDAKKRKEMEDKDEKGKETIKLIVINNFIFGKDGDRTQYTDAIDKIRKLQKDLNLPHEDVEDDINKLKNERGKANWKTAKKDLVVSNALGAFSRAGESAREKRNQKEKEKREKELREAGKNKLVVLKSLLAAGLKAKNNKNLLKKETLDRAKAKVNAINALLSEGEDRREDREDRRIRFKGAIEKIKALKRFKKGGIEFRNKMESIKRKESEALKKAEKIAEKRREREKEKKDREKERERNKRKVVKNPSTGDQEISVDNPKKRNCDVKQLRSGKWVVFVKGFKIRGLKEVSRRNAKWFINTSGITMEEGRSCAVKSCRDYPIYHHGKRSRTLFFNNRTLNVGNKRPSHLQFFHGTNGGRIINVPLANCKVKNR